MKQKLRKDFVLNSVNFFFISLFNYIFKMIEDTFLSSYAIVVIVDQHFTSKKVRTSIFLHRREGNHGYMKSHVCPWN